MRGSKLSLFEVLTRRKFIDMYKHSSVVQLRIIWSAGTLLLTILSSISLHHNVCFEFKKCIAELQLHT